MMKSELAPLRVGYGVRLSEAHFFKQDPAAAAAAGGGVYPGTRSGHSAAAAAAAASPGVSSRSNESAAVAEAEAKGRRVAGSGRDNNGRGPNSLLFLVTPSPLRNPRFLS